MSYGNSLADAYHRVGISTRRIFEASNRPAASKLFIGREAVLDRPS
jgi:hypothetical protein